MLRDDVARLRERETNNSCRHEMNFQVYEVKCCAFVVELYVAV